MCFCSLYVCLCVSLDLPCMCVLVCIFSSKPCCLTCFSCMWMYGSVFMPVRVCVCVCARAAVRRSRAACFMKSSGLLTATLHPVKYENNSLWEWRAAVGAMRWELKEVWTVCTCSAVYACLRVYQSPQPNCYYRDRAGRLACPSSLRSFSKPLIIHTWNVPFKRINYVHVVSIQIINQD